MPAPHPGRAARARRLLPLLLAAAGLGIGAPAAHAHGGTTIVDGSRDGVSVLVQGTASETASGGPAVDISTILNGPGSGPEATIDYWIRPSGGRTFKVETERDEGGTYHADISTADRGTWSDWDLSAIVTLSDGERLRVTNAEGSDIPGPAPTQASDDEPAATTGNEPAPTEPTLSEGSTTPSKVLTPPAEVENTPIDDISGESDGPPAWAFPSFLALAVIGLAILAVQRRRNGGPSGDE